MVLKVKPFIQIETKHFNRCIFWSNTSLFRHSPYWYNIIDVVFPWIIEVEIDILHQASSLTNLASR